MKIIAISDTHGLHRSLQIPDGDILVHAGDLSRHGTLDDVREFTDFLGSLPHPQNIVIAGNHDFCLEKEREACEEILPIVSITKTKKRPRTPCSPRNYYHYCLQRWHNSYIRNLDIIELVSTVVNLRQKTHLKLGL